MNKKALLTLLAALMISGTAFASTNDSVVTAVPQDVTEAAIAAAQATIAEEVQAPEAEKTEAELAVQRNENGSLEVVKVETAEK